MSIYVNEEMNPDWYNDEVHVHPEGVIGVTNEDEIINEISRNVHFDFKHVRKLEGHERYLALCEKLGLHPKERK